MKPILKWAGGKRWLLPLLQEVWKPYAAIDARLVEPFTGGMAVALGLNPNKALLNDANAHLINFYNQVKKGLQITQNLKNNSHYYYEMRNKFNDFIIQNKFRSKEAASIFYYLIRTGFNGLCRFNSSGAFNVPFGSHQVIKYKTDFLEYRELLQNWELKNKDFEKISLQEEDFLYADPPYDVEFTRYHKNDFTWDDQLRLGLWLAKHPGPIIASNQATPRVLELYQDLKFTVLEIEAPRMIACNGDRRPAIEMLAFKNCGRTVLKNIRKNVIAY